MLELEFLTRLHGGYVFNAYKDQDGVSAAVVMAEMTRHLAQKVWAGLGYCIDPYLVAGHVTR